MVLIFRKKSSQFFANKIARARKFGIHMPVAYDVLYILPRLLAALIFAHNYLVKAPSLPTLTTVRLHCTVDVRAGCQLGVPAVGHGGVCIMPPLEVESCRQALANAKR